MIYNLKNSRSVIYKVYDTFNIEGSEWESRAPEWIVNAMSEINSVLALSEIREIVQVEQYRFKLPCNIKVLGGILYNTQRLTRSKRYTTSDTQEKRNIGEYIITNEGWVYLDGIENGEVTVVYKTYPYIFDQDIQRQVPLIPDKEEVEIALMWYCMRQLLYRGYKHLVVTFNSNDPDINPNLAWDKYKKLAKNAINRMDSDARYKLSIRNQSLISFEEVDHKARIL